MKSHKIVFVSKDKSFKFEKNNAEQFERQNPTVTFEYVQDNTTPLAAVYNIFIKRHRQRKDLDSLIFMHADVTLDFEKMLKHIEEVESKYDVLGLCGCSKISLSQKPLNWFCGSRPFPESRWGCVTHGELGNSTSYFSSHSPDILDHEVSCIDGLCIILTRKAIEKSTILFDDRFGFNQYDTDFSLECILNHKLKLGVIVQKDLNHFSVGKSILTDDFLKSEQEFRSKWSSIL